MNCSPAGGRDIIIGRVWEGSQQGAAMSDRLPKRPKEPDSNLGAYVVLFAITVGVAGMAAAFIYGYWQIPVLLGGSLIVGLVHSRS